MGGDRVERLDVARGIEIKQRPSTDWLSTWRCIAA
jgi:hypothetical protein